MKKVRHILRFNWISFVLIMLLAIGCSKEEGPFATADTYPDAMLKKAKITDGMYVLEGTTHFPSYAVKEHKDISLWESNPVPCDAILTIDGRDFTLVTTEYFGTIPFRIITFNGHISASGKLSFFWPDTWIQFGSVHTRDGLDDQIFEHTGCIIYGPGTGEGDLEMNYKGKFDGTTFYADVHFMGKQVQFGTVPEYTEAVLGKLIEGPVQFNFSIELEVVTP